MPPRGLPFDVKICGVTRGDDLRELAAAYHSYYDAERILVEDPRVKRARLALVAATAQVLHNGLAVLGVSAPTSM